MKMRLFTTEFRHVERGGKPGAQRVGAASERAAQVWVRDVKANGTTAFPGLRHEPLRLFLFVFGRSYFHAKDI
jgi:hypothetical protein